MRWIIGTAFVAAFACLAGTGHAITPAAATAGIEAGRDAGSLTQEVARRHDRHHRRHARHHRHPARR